jgi:hypothetical protein
MRDLDGNMARQLTDDAGTQTEGQFSRRAFLQSAGLLATGPMWWQSLVAEESRERDVPRKLGIAAPQLPPIKASWIWYPEQVTPPGSFMFFRKTFRLAERPSGPQIGWVSGNSRYMLYVNGHFVQRGPAPCDPRVWDVDPIDLSPYLQTGDNVIAGLVCYFGHGDGTWVPFTPVGQGSGGFLFQASLPASAGTLELKTDSSWKVSFGRCWTSGRSKRWFLRALQEIYDARLFPEGWNTPTYDDSGWAQANELAIPAGQPMTLETPQEGRPAEWRLVPRSLPALKETAVRPKRLAGAGWIRWKVPPEEYLDRFPANAFEEQKDDNVVQAGNRHGMFPLKVATAKQSSAAVTLEFEEEIAGHVFVRFRAPAGTTVEILFSESADPQRLMLTTAPAYRQWARIVAREGETAYETFEYEAVRWLQLLIRGATGPVEILDVGVRRRTYDYPHHPDLKTSDATVNRVLGASVNTRLNVGQDLCVDNIVRERQHYPDLYLDSYYGFGEYRQASRGLRTWILGQNREGWFFDCWPAWDRCDRLWQSHLNLTIWKPLLDVSLFYPMIVARYHLFSADRKLIEEVFPRLMRFDRWLRPHEARDGLLPISGYPWHSVWIEHHGYKAHADKHAAFNILYVAYLREGMARLADGLGEPRRAEEYRQRADRIADRLRALYWSPTDQVFVDNLPRVREDGEYRLHEWTLSVALLHGLVPEGEESHILDLLASPSTKRTESSYPVSRPAGVMGFSHPGNAAWRLWALSRYGRADAVVRDLRERYGNMTSIRLNNTLSEEWNPTPGGGSAWCQNYTAPLFVLYGDILGLRPTSPGFAEFDVRPQLGGLDSIEGTVHTVKGPLRIECRQRKNEKKLVLRISAPPGTKPSVVLPSGAQLLGTPQGTRPQPGPVSGTKRWRLPSESKERLWELNVRG